MCCSVLQCVSVCCSVLQCVTYFYCSLNQHQQAIKAAELKIADMFKKGRELEAAKRGLEKQVAEASATNSKLQASLDALQVLLQCAAVRCSELQ